MTQKYTPVKTLRVEVKDHKAFRKTAKMEGKTQARLFRDMFSAYKREQQRALKAGKGER